MDEKASNIDKAVVNGQPSAGEAMARNNQFRPCDCTVSRKDVITQNEENSGDFNNEDVVFNIGFSHFEGCIHEAQNRDRVIGSRLQPDIMARFQDGLRELSKKRRRGQRTFTTSINNGIDRDMKRTNNNANVNSRITSGSHKRVKRYMSMSS